MNNGCWEPLYDTLPNELPEEHRDLLSEDNYGDRNITRYLANSSSLMKAVFTYMEAVHEYFTWREMELIVLATVRSLRAEYEWHQHVEFAREAGLSTDEVRAIGNDDFSPFPAD